MSLVNVVGSPIWTPPATYGLWASPQVAVSDSLLIDADTEEIQVIGDVTTDDGASHTFGTSGSAIVWLPGASIAFIAVATVRVGVKKASSISTSAGPPAQATTGTAAYDVYKDLVGGTDVITSTTVRSDAMANGTPFTVADADQICIALTMSITSGVQSVKARCYVSTNNYGYPICSIFTSGTTFTQQTVTPNFILVFDDGHIGWIEPTQSVSVTQVATANVGSGNYIGNIFRVPYSCKVNSITAAVNCSTNAANFDLALISTPLGTPSVMTSASCDANQITAGTGRVVTKKLATPQTLTINTDYCVAIKQTSATALTGVQWDVQAAAQLAAWGMGAECYAANSTAGATFVQQNSGKRRYFIYAGVSALGTDAGGAAGMLYQGEGMG